MKVVKLIEENNTLLKFGIAFEFPEARIKVHDKIQCNNDVCKYNRNTTLPPLDTPILSFGSQSMKW